MQGRRKEVRGAIALPLSGGGAEAGNGGYFGFGAEMSDAKEQIRTSLLDSPGTCQVVKFS